MDKHEIVERLREHFRDITALGERQVEKYWSLHSSRDPVIRSFPFGEVGDAVLREVEIPQEFFDWAMRTLNEQNDHEIEERGTLHASINRAIETDQNSLDELTKMRYRGLIDDEEYLRQKQELVQSIATLRERLRGTEARADKWLELTERTFAFARYARHHFAFGTPQRKREILAALGSNLVLKDRKLLIEVRKPFEIIAKGLAAQSTETVPFEPETVGSTKRKISALAPANPSWRRGWDSRSPVVPPRPSGLDAGLLLRGPGFKKRTAVYVF